MFIFLSAFNLVRRCLGSGAIAIVIAVAATTPGHFPFLCQVIKYSQVI